VSGEKRRREDLSSAQAGPVVFDSGRKVQRGD
jgi:hypothetical protein